MRSLRPHPRYYETRAASYRREVWVVLIEAEIRAARQAKAAGYTAAEQHRLTAARRLLEKVIRAHTMTDPHGRRGVVAEFSPAVGTHHG
ncbi:hypothetical protein VQH23_23895 [Pararoseomonas sp. SCSIO 73927]|uniref:hypothetical protein n=1 Tax=Pararoseomonas sp. SCSIO 73927 TaxID=3114537 RepID=UPI0030D34251